MEAATLDAPATFKPDETKVPKTFVAEAPSTFVPESSDQAPRSYVGALSEFGMSEEPSPEELGGAKEFLTTPLVKLPEAPRFEGDVPVSGYPSLAASVAWNKVVKPFGEFALSPAGIMTAGAGATGGPLTQRTIAALFAADVASTVPEAARKAGEASVTGTPQEKLESFTELATAVGLPAVLGASALAPRTFEALKQTEAAPAAKPEEVPSALQERQATAVHGNVPGEPVQGEGQVPLAERPGGVPQSELPGEPQAEKEVAIEKLVQPPPKMDWDSWWETVIARTGPTSTARRNAEYWRREHQEALAKDPNAPAVIQDPGGFNYTVLTPKLAGGLAVETISPRDYADRLAQAKQVEPKAAKEVAPAEAAAPATFEPEPQAAPEPAVAEGPGAATPSEFGPVQPLETSIKNEVTAAKRLTRGMAPVEEEAARQWGTVWEDVKRQVESDPMAAERLVDELQAKPRAVTDREDALLLHQQVYLEDQYNRTVRAMLDAAETEGETAIPEHRIRLGQLSDQLLALYDVDKSAGRETARGLNARKMVANETFSLVQMEMAKRAANDGRRLTTEEETAIRELHDKIAATQAAFDEHVAKSEARIRELETQHAVDELKIASAREVKEEAAAGTERDLPGERERIVAGLRGQSDKPLQDLRPWIRKLALNLVRGGISDRDALATTVHGILQEIFPEVTLRETMDAISGYGDFRPLDPEAAKAKLRDLSGQMQQVAKLEDLLARKALAKTGPERKTLTDEERRLTKLVNEYKRRYGVVVTDPAKQLKSTLDAIKTSLTHQIADLEYQIATGKKIVRGKTKVEYDAEAAALVARRDALKARFDEVFGKPEMSDEQRVAAAKKALESSIEDYQKRIATGDIGPRAKESKTPLTAQLQVLRDQRDALKSQLQELRDADTQLQERKAIESLNQSIAEYERRIQENDLATKAQKPGVDTPEVRALREKRDQTRLILQEMREQSGMYDTRRIAAAEKAVDASIEETIRQINEGDLAARKATPRATSPELEAKRAELADLQKIKQKLRNAAKPKKSPEQIALASLKTRLRNQTADLLRRASEGDFTKPARRTVTLDAEAQTLKAANLRAKEEFQRALNADRLKNRTTPEKWMDMWLKVRRAEILSSPVVLAKLTTAAVQRTLFNPLEELIGAAWGKLPGYEKVAARSPVEGGFSPAAEAKAITEGMVRGIKGSAQLLKTGKSNLETLHGRRIGEGGFGEARLQERHWLDFVGELHGALKEPVKQMAFERAMQKQIEFGIREGVDVSDQLVQANYAIQAYKAAQRAIFLQDNLLVSKVNGFLATRIDPRTGHPTTGSKAFSTAGRTLLPIVRVPSNIVAETFQYAGGLVTGNVKLLRALRRGIETLPPEEADLIMRNLKKGSIGGAFILAGFLLPDVVGGYYQAGERRKGDEVKPGEVGPVPSYLLHNPALETLQLGATIRRVADSRLTKRAAEDQGIGAGVVAGALGLTEEIPPVREMLELGKAFNPHERGQFFGELIKSLVVPQAVQWLARQTDKDAEGEVTKRKPEGILEHIETGIPGLREDVPEPRRSSR